ncbi:MAG: protein translocase subunit SecF [Duodenibacillus sp.]|nr:protein translocase subunit SecF [Duodenibacillus sp.]
MEFFRISKTIPFMRHAFILNTISVVTFLVAVFFIFWKGLTFSIEFTGGTQVVVQYPAAVATEQVREDIKAGMGVEAAVQNYGTARDLMIRLPLKEGVSSGQQAQELMKVLQTKEPNVKLLNNEFVGPQVGEELATDGGTALILVVIGIMIYLAIRFEWKFALAAIIANMHDVFIVVGIFAITGWEFSLPVLAAVLAVLGYSVNESVIIFDRVREHFRKMRRTDTVEVINSAITATISRTVITHSSTLAMTLSMFFFGGPALHYFSLALTIGILLGVYSSVFVSAAVAMYLGVKREDLVKPVKKDEVQEMVP